MVWPQPTGWHMMFVHKIKLMVHTMFANQIKLMVDTMRHSMLVDGWIHDFHHLEDGSHGERTKFHHDIDGSKIRQRMYTIYSWCTQSLRRWTQCLHEMLHNKNPIRIFFKNWVVFLTYRYNVHDDLFYGDTWPSQFLDGVHNLHNYFTQI